VIKVNSAITGLALAGVVALGATAALADGVPTRAPRAVVEAPFSWTGFYVGGNVGGAWIDDDPFRVTAADAGTAAFWDTNCLRNGACPFSSAGKTGSGVIGGIQAGYNLQFGSALVGLETDIQGSTAHASRARNLGIIPGINPATPFNDAANTDLEWLGTIRARLGFLVSPSFLAYVTGGWAYSHVQQDWGRRFCDGANVCLGNALGRAADWSTGWTGGAGVEWLLTNKVTIGAEYLFVALDGGNGFRATGVGGNSTCTPTNCNFNVRPGDLDVNIARIKVNFKL